MIAGPCERSTGSRCSFTRLLLLLPLPCQRWWPGRSMKVWTEKWEPSVSCWPLTAKSNLHVFSKLIVMMAFVDAIFCSCCNFSFLRWLPSTSSWAGSERKRVASAKRTADASGYRLNIWWGPSEGTNKHGQFVVVIFWRLKLCSIKQKRRAGRIL